LHRHEIESCLEDERAVCQSLQRKRPTRARAR
jgi:hypothetical protein